MDPAAQHAVKNVAAARYIHRDDLQMLLERLFKPQVDFKVSVSVSDPSDASFFFIDDGGMYRKRMIISHLRRRGK